ncbi:MAG: DNA topoisomerase 3 [Bacteroidaceae bacterium]|nr:DNA topoisomerase 3 [Bacteroidaceae bacterium]
MTVCIAEKPSVARDIARVLGANTSHEGYMEGAGYQVTWTFGHLCELKNPEDYTPMWRRWTLGSLPMVPERFGIRLKADQGVERQFEVIRTLMAQADEIINCGDAGQEGELIQRWVMQKAGAKCPVKRLWISSLTEEAIREGFQNLRPADDYRPLYEAGLCRAIGDWLLGMNATRLYTLKYRSGQYGQPPLSVGRVQTPTLALIVRRDHEIAHFTPEPYWVLTTTYRDTLFSAVMAQPDADEEPDEDGRKGKKAPAPRGFATEEEGRAALDKIRGVPLTVTKVEKKNGTEAPPRLFDLTSLQVECNKKFGLSADETLKTIQSLYEKKVTTYPRVDTTYLPDDVYPKCKATLNGIAKYYATELQPLRGAKLLKRKKVFDNSKVTDHHAIIPTGVEPNNLTEAERRVYDLVARRFIANFYPDCRFATTTVLAEAADVPFRVSGKVILEPAWRTVINPGGDAPEAADTDPAADKERVLPAFTVGESGPHEPSLAQKFTQPPKHYTEATLLRAMETAGRTVDDDELRDALKENGIGRPSTRAAIIETLFRRGYIVKQRKSLLATATGTELISLIREDLLKSAELTGRWEKKLREIERREYSAPQFIAELKEMVAGIVTQVLADNSNRRVAEAAQTAKPAKSSANSASPASASKKSAAASPAAANAPAAKRIRVGSKCPVCGQGKVIKGHTAYGCSRWREGCTFRKPFKS